MGPVTKLEPPDKRTLSRIETALTRVDPTAVKRLTTKRRHRVRELLKPQANGDQDAW